MKHREDMFTDDFWKATAERAAATAAQSALAILGAEGVGLLDADWQAVASASVMAALLSILKSLVASSSLVPGEGPSLVQAEQTTPAHPEPGGEGYDYTYGETNNTDDLPTYHDEG